MFIKILRYLSLLGFTHCLFSADVTVSTDISTDTVWTADNEYILEKPIYVINDATLTIEPGTTIYGTKTTAGTFGSLVITAVLRSSHPVQHLNRLFSPLLTKETTPVPLTSRQVPNGEV